MFTGARLSGEFAIPPGVDLVAIILFAITGAFSAAKRNYDWIGVMAIAFVTGCGGGILRDILLNKRPIILEDETILIAVIAAVAVSATFAQELAKVRWLFTVAEALALPMYAVFGTNK